MQVAVNGLITGLTIALLALAFTVVYLPTRVFHLALGGVYVAVPYVAWACLRGEWPWYLAVATAAVTGITLSILCEMMNHAPLERRGASSGAHLISSLGLNLLIVQMVALLWGNDPKVLRMGLDPVTSVADLVLTRTQLVTVGVSVVLLAGFYAWLRFSNWGLQLRALADNPAEMALRGYNVRRLRLVAFGLSGLLASTAALTVAVDVGFTPHGGLPALLLAVVAMIVGGRQSFVGPLVGGVVLASVRAEVVWYFSARWQEAVTFLLLGVFLLLRPGGIFGRTSRPEANA